MPRLIVFGGAPSTAELAADWSTPTTSPAFEPLSSGDVEQESIEESYERSQMHSLPDSEEPQAEALEATTRLMRVPSLAQTPSEVLLPPPSMRSQSSVSSTGNSAQGEDSYVGATTMNNIHSGTSIDLRLPDYRFSVLSLTPLSDCHKQIQNSRGEVDVLGYVTKVEGLREICMKDSRMAKLWKVELGDDSSNGKALGMLKVTAWDGTAEALNKDVQQGDVLYLSRIGLTWNRYEGAVTGTTTRRSTCQVCWRTRLGDSAKADQQELRPALGLAVQFRHAPSVKVAQTLEWAAASGFLLA